jgi:glycosyltransferase involved in cell wall biosynthesis
MARGSSAIVANSHYTAQQFDGIAPRGVVEVVHNPIDCSHYDPGSLDRTRARADLGLGADDVVLAVIGYLAPAKCQDDAIRILAGVRREHPRARLVLAGSTRFTAPGARDDSTTFVRLLGDLAAELGVESDVVFTGEVSDIRGVFGATDLLLVPSRQEGFGRVALEGMAMGVPVVATSVGGTTEVVRDGTDGLILDPGEPVRWAAAVSALLADSDRRAMMSDSGRRRAMSDFSPRAHRDGVLSVYERVLAEAAKEQR